MKRIYLDHAATTPMDRVVKKAMDPYFSQISGNAGSLHQVGREAKKAITKARQKIAKILNCKPEEVIFTGSGTESDNMAILGTARACAFGLASKLFFDAGTRFASSGKSTWVSEKFTGSPLNNIGSRSLPHIIVSNIEHHAVLYPVLQLEKEGFKVDYLKVDKDGLVSPENLKSLITDETILVSVMYANNEIGTIQPIAEIGKIIKFVREDRQKRGIAIPIYFHTDACQAAGYLDLDVQKLGVDLMTINGSKIYGPKGVGVLYVKTGVKIASLIYGGGQERGLRSGTENTPGIIGLAIALEMAQKNRVKESSREAKLRDYFINQVLKIIPKVVLNGHNEKRLPNNINISILDVEGEAMMLWLDKYGICVSTGSACDSQSLEPSHVILALGRPYEYANGNLRFTLGKSTTKKDLDYVLNILPKIVKNLRKISPINFKV